MGWFLEALSDLAIQAELWGVGNTLRRIREEQWLGTSRIVAGLNSVREAVDELRASVERQTSVLEGGFATLDARLDFQTHVLGKVLDTLYRPSEVKARELRERGERALRARLYEDALTDFQSSLGENRYDFTCHFVVGAIQWEQLGNEEAARNACDLALKYAQVRRDDSEDPSPSFYSSLALLLMGRISEAGGSLDAALRYYADACLASPDYGDCFRHYASAAAQLGRVDLALTAIRAAIAVDAGQAVLIQQDEALCGLGGALTEELASIRDKNLGIASRLLELIEESLATYTEAKRRYTSSGPAKPAATESEGGKARKLGRREAYVREALAFADGQKERRGLLEAMRAVRVCLGVIPDVMSDIGDIERGVESRAAWRRQDSREQIASLRGHANREMESSAIEDQGGGWLPDGCAIAFSGLFVWPLMSVCLFFWLVAFNSDVALRPLFAVAAGGLSLSFVLLLFGFRLSKRRRKQEERESRARDIMEPARQIHAEAEREESELRNIAGQMETLRNTLATSAEQLLASQYVSCSLVLLDPGAKEDGYDEGKLAQALVGISREHIESKPLSPTLARDLIRDCPRILLTGLSIPDAEGIAARLRREFKASVGIKRRFIGEFPPQPKAIEAPSAPSSGRRHWRKR